jgi:UDP-N-acetyl-D-glucosamine dehydrogenase
MSLQKPQVLAIIGQGYVGFPLAIAAVDAGWTVIGVDTNDDKVAQLNAGSSPVEDISDAQLNLAIAKGSYIATTDFSTVSQASVITICVPTPLNDKREPDLALLRSAVTLIARYVSNETLIVNESTSFPGTLRDVIVPLFNSLKSNDSMTNYFASAPERVNPGDLLWNQKNTPRLVGAIDTKSQSKALKFYNSICSEVIAVSTPEIAEAAKLLENTFRLINIALINEFAQVCNASGLNINEVIEAASSKPYGFMPFKPGVGVGGHCIPVDPLYLTWWARQNGGQAILVETADLINHNMPKYVAMRALSMINVISRNPKVLILGVAYKSGVSDVRETPVSELRDHLLANGADVAWYDPLVSVWQGLSPVDLNWDCDIAILATNQPGMNLEKILLKGVQILDCTNSINGLTGVVSL